MIVGLLQFEIIIEHATSLKDKRSVVKSLKDRLHREHLVAVAEVDHLDQHRSARMGVALVSNEVSHCQSTLDKLIDKLRGGRDFVLSDHHLEILTGQ